jgi:hypothetical protein
VRLQGINDGQSERTPDLVKHFFPDWWEPPIWCKNPLCEGFTPTKECISSGCPARVSFYTAVSSLFLCSIICTCCACFIYLLMFSVFVIGAAKGKEMVCYHTSPWCMMTSNQKSDPEWNAAIRRTWYLMLGRSRWHQGQFKLYWLDIANGLAPKPSSLKLLSLN